MATPKRTVPGKTAVSKLREEWHAKRIAELEKHIEQLTKERDELRISHAAAVKDLAELRGILKSLRERVDRLGPLSLSASIK